MSLEEFAAVFLWGCKCVIGQSVDLTFVRRVVIVKVRERITSVGIGEPSSADCVCVMEALVRKSSCRDMGVKGRGCKSQNHRIS